MADTEKRKAAQHDDYMAVRRAALIEEFSRIPTVCEASDLEEWEEMVPMSDGVLLRTFVIRQKGREKMPVLYTRSCYPHGFELDMEKNRAMAQRGFGVVFQYCRGTGGSEGVWEPNMHERPDGIDGVNWVAAQDWVESIGYYGESYLALTGWAWIDVAPEKVKGMYLSVYGTNRHVSAYKDGLFRQDILTAWSMGNAGVPVKADLIESCKYMPQVRVDRDLWGVDLPWYRDMITHTDYADPYWQEGFWSVLRSNPAKVKIPIVFEEGWYDHHMGSAMAGYRTMQGEGLAQCLLRIGPWNHGKQTVIEGHDCPNGAGNQITDIYNFFHTLLIEKQQPESGVSLYEVGEDRWIHTPAWPEPSGEMLLYLQPGSAGSEDAADGQTAAGSAGASGRLCETVADAEAVISYDYDPQNPVMSNGEESTFASWGCNASKVQPGPDWRPDVISFVSAPFEKDTEILGQMHVDLFVKSDAEDTAFSAKIMEVAPDGTAYNIRTGITTLGYRGHSDVRQTYAPGEVVRIDIDTWDIAWCVKAGYRIRVDITSSNFPQYSIHSNYPGVWAEQAQTKVARQTICMGPDCPSVLRIPLR